MDDCSSDGGWEVIERLREVALFPIDAVECDTEISTDCPAHEGMQSRCRAYATKHCELSRFMNELIELYEREIDAKRP